MPSCPGPETFLVSFFLRLLPSCSLCLYIIPQLGKWTTWRTAISFVLMKMFYLEYEPHIPLDTERMQALKRVDLGVNSGSTPPSLWALWQVNFSEPAFPIPLSKPCRETAGSSCWQISKFRNWGAQNLVPQLQFWSDRKITLKSRSWNKVTKQEEPVEGFGTAPSFQRGTDFKYHDVKQ
jgi:hypothetical protein